MSRSSRSKRWQAPLLARTRSVSVTSSTSCAPSSRRQTSRSPVRWPSSRAMTFARGSRRSSRRRGNREGAQGRRTRSGRTARRERAPDRARAGGCGGTGSLRTWSRREAAVTMAFEEREPGQFHERRTQVAEATREQVEEQVTEERPAPPVPLDSETLYTNRELSWLDFNERVLALAEGDEMPLLERLKFLSIYSTNLDEFFMVRVAGHHDQVDAGIDARDADGLSPSETLDRIAERARELGARHAREWQDGVRPALEREGIRIVTCAECSERELKAVDRAFHDQIFPALTPLAVGPGRPFPYISNLSLSLAVWVRDPASEHETFARVKVPKEVLPRFVPIGKDTFVPLEAIIARHLDRLFPGMEVVTHDMFRVSRDADFTVSDEADDLLRAVEDELRRRRFGEVVRLEVGAGMDPDLRRRLVEWLELEERQVYDVEGMLDLGDLSESHGIDGHPDLPDPQW